jgi:hypothetical protein
MVLTSVYLQVGAGGSVTSKLELFGTTKTGVDKFKRCCRSEMGIYPPYIAPIRPLSYTVGSRNACGGGRRLKLQSAPSGPIPS